jgi:hypothetical protein
MLDKAYIREKGLEDKKEWRIGKDLKGGSHGSCQDNASTFYRKE